MTTSGTYIFSVTRDTIIRQAMLNIGKLDDNEVPNAQQTTDAATALNMLVKQWQGKTDFAPGLKMWTRRRGYLFLSNTTGQYTVGPGGTGWTTAPLFTATTAAAAANATTLQLPTGTGIAATYNIGIVLTSGAIFWTTVVSMIGTTCTLTAGITTAASIGAQVYAYASAGTQPVQIETVLLRDNTLNDVPLRVMTTQDYDYLPQKANPQNVSDPGAIYYEFQLTNGILRTDVGASQDLTKYLVMTYMEAIQDFNSALDTPEYPQEWFLALCWGLAKQIAPQYNSPWTPLMQDNYTTALRIAQQKDPERVTMFFQPGED
jgi:hypothetical protein